MKSLIEFFLARRFLVNLISVFVVIVGLFYLRALKRDLIPPMAFKGVSIYGSFPGASALQMERFVTEPIESTLDGLRGVKEMTSSSMPSNSSIQLRFFDDVSDLDDLVDEINTRMARLQSDLPGDVEDIQVFQWKSDSSYFRSFAFMGIDPQNNEHRDFVSSSRDEFLAQPGVVEVNHNLQTRSLNIDISTDKLKFYELNLASVLERVKSETKTTAVGSLDEGSKEYTVEIQSSVSSIADLENLILRSPDVGAPLKLKDIATVAYRYEDPKDLRLLNGEGFVEFWTQKAVGNDIVDLNVESEAIVASIQEKAPAGVKVIPTGSGSDFVTKQLDVLRNNAAIGLVLVLLTLGFFLGPRLALITAIGVPISYLGTFIILHSLGITINLISLIAMILIIGILVDDAIVVSEKYASLLQKGRSRSQAAKEAALSMLSPVTAGIVTTMIAFAPIVFAGGWMREVMISIPIVIISALAISWLEAFLILPEHLKSFVSGVPKERRIMATIQKFYSFLLKGALRFRYLCLIAIAGLFVSAVFLLTQKIRSDFSLRISSRTVNVFAVLKDDVSKEQLLSTLNPVTNYLQTLGSDEGVKRVYLKAGNIWMDGENRESLRYVNFKLEIDEQAPHPDRLELSVLKKVQAELPQFKTDAFERLNAETQMGAGRDDDLSSMYTLNFVGSAPYAFKDLVAKTEELAKPLPGFVAISYDLNKTGQSYEFIEDRKLLNIFGLDKSSLALQLRSHISTHELETLRWGERPEKLTLSLNTGSKTENLRHLESLPLQSAQGIFINASKVGRWQEHEVQKVWERKDRKRTISLNIKFNPEQVRAEDFKASLDKALPALRESFPGYAIGAEIADKKAKESKEWILRIIAMCVLGIFFVLAIQLNSLTQPLLVCSSILFGFVGAVWAIFLHGHKLELMGMIGLLGVAGIAVNASVIMVDHINKMSKQKLDLKSIHQGCLERVRPIVLTTITTLGGLFPMAYGIGGDSGFTKPMALSMAWGLFSATCLTLFAIPIFLAVNEDVKSFLKSLGSRLSNFRIKDFRFRRKAKAKLAYEN